MSITKTILPEKSILKSEETMYDYIDSYHGDFNDKNGKITSTEIGKLFFTSSPEWVDKLFEIRNRIVGLFGLKTSGSIDNRNQILDNFSGELGESVGLFKIFYKSVDEIVLGEDDKHLDFRVSLFIQRNQNEMNNLVISTAVKYNHWLGRLYFLPVSPFHKLIVPTMLKRMIYNIETLKR